jgi:phosphatidylglycerol:prolipoprotein diacylglycerol transferase
MAGANPISRPAIVRADGAGARQPGRPETCRALVERARFRSRPERILRAEGSGRVIESTSEGFHPEYVIPVLLGLGLAIFFPSGRAIRDPEARSSYRLIQIVTLIGAIVGAKLAAVVGDLRWPFEALPEGFLFMTGRSITGALLGGFVTAELAKPLFGYREPPNDRFATVLPFSIAIGRVGCLLAGCCNGVATDFALALPDADGVMRHPTALYDLLFHVALGTAFVAMGRRGVLKHRFFAIHLVAYGVFRFAIEALRDSREYALSMSAYQFFALAMIGCGIFGLLRRIESRESVAGAAVAAS